MKFLIVNLLCVGVTLGTGVPALQHPLLSYSERVVGGEEVARNSLPYQVALLTSTADGVFFCGGSLISPTCILTAAHCVDKAQIVEVRLGAHEVQSTTEPTQQRVTTTLFTVHKDWNNATLVNDIAMVKLQEPITPTSAINFITLPSRADATNTLVNQPATCSGWGLTSDSDNGISPVLRSATMSVMTNMMCNVYYIGRIQSGHICCSSMGGKSSCNGDSGGPLTATIGGIKKLCGIVSFGSSLGCQSGFPSCYTRVTSYLDWIQDNSDVVIQQM